MRLLTAALLLAAAAALPAAGGERVELVFDPSEAEAVLAVLEKRGAGREVTEADWEKLFAARPYVRLKQREAAMRRNFTDAEFRSYVLSPELAGRAADLRRTLEAWKRADLVAVARRILPYLPEASRIRAEVYPVIKPRTNSFVWEAATDPAVFLYLDVEQSRSAFENTVAHEAHHLGLVDGTRRYDELVAGLSPGPRKAAEWMGAFGEGLAVLAAAGSADVHPLADFEPADRTRWDQDMEGFDAAFRQVEQFFLDAVGGGFARPEVADHVGFTFFGYRGPWYLIGYRMGALVEKRFGRAALVECMADPRRLLARYNQAAAEHNAAAAVPLPLWSPELLAAVLPAAP